MNPELDPIRLRPIPVGGAQRGAQSTLAYHFSPLPLRKDGFEVETETFNLKSKDGRHVRVTFVAKEQPESAVGDVGRGKESPAPAIAPFDAEEAKRHQEEWAEYLGVPVVHTNSIGKK